MSRPVPTMPNVPSAHHAHQIPPMSMSHGLINMLRPLIPAHRITLIRDCAKALVSPAADLHHLSTGDRRRIGITLGGDMAKPAVIVVGADKGGVGKTTVSRTVLDYFSANNVATRAFDTESPRGTLKRFHPDVTEIVDISTTADQMKILDTLNAMIPSVTVIDVRAGLLSPSLVSLRNIGFLEAAKAGEITFAVFHILGSSIASLDEIAETANFMTGAKYFLVKNFINNTSFFEWDHSTYNSYFHRIKNATELTIPKLDEMAFEQVEVASVPFLKFVANKGVHDEAANNSFVLRGYVRHWLANIWSEYDRIKLTDIVGSTKFLGREQKGDGLRRATG